jgi:hypothetical protein
VRRSWADPLGWAGLQKVPPREQDHLAALAVHAGELAAELARLDAAIDVERAGLRLLSAAVRALDGRADLRPSFSRCRDELAGRERELLATAARRTVLAAELEACRDHLAHPAPEAPDAHLRRRVTTQDRPALRRPRFLKVWAAVSTPLLVLTIVVLLTAPPLAFLSSVVVFAGLFLGVEAAARGRLLAFLGGLAATAATGTVVVLLVVGLLRNWQVVLAVLLTVAAVVLFATNIRELRRG